MHENTAMRVDTCNDDVTRVTFLHAKIIDDQLIVRLGYELLQLVEQGVRKCILNFRDVEYISAHFFQKILTVQKCLQEKNGKLVLCEFCAPMQEFLNITKLDKSLRIVSDQAGALAAF